MSKQIFITSTTVNSKMWKRERGCSRWDNSSLDELKKEVAEEDVVFFNILNNLALVNYLRKQGVEVEYKERTKHIHAGYGDVIYEIYGDAPLKDIKTEESLPKFTIISIRRHVCSEN